jgi:hypothetical protein
VLAVAGLTNQRARARVGLATHRSDIGRTRDRADLAEGAALASTTINRRSLQRRGGRRRCHWAGQFAATDQRVAGGRKQDDRPTNRAKPATQGRLPRQGGLGAGSVLVPTNSAPLVARTQHVHRYRPMALTKSLRSTRIDRRSIRYTQTERVLELGCRTYPCQFGAGLKRASQFAAHRRATRSLSVL